MYLLTLVYMYSLFIPLTADPIDACVQIDSCSCINSRGVIDLHPLASTSGEPKFKDVQDSTGSYYYSWNPCFPFTEGPTSCYDVMGCETDLTNYFNLGTPDSAKFIVDTKKGLILQYTAATDISRTLDVILKCDESEEGSVDVKGEDPPGSAIYEMTLSSKYCCPYNNTLTTLPPTTTATPTTTPTPVCPVFNDNIILLLLISILIALLLLMFLSAIIICLLVRKTDNSTFVPNKPNSYHTLN